MHCGYDGHLEPLKASPVYLLPDKSSFNQLDAGLVLAVSAPKRLT